MCENKQLSIAGIRHERKALEDDMRAAAEQLVERFVRRTGLHVSSISVPMVMTASRSGDAGLDGRYRVGHCSAQVAL